MIRKTVTVQMENGMNTRPVARLVQVASQFSSEIFLEMENRRVNAKSIMGMMTLGVDTGAELVIAASGEDEENAVSALEAYLTGNA